MSVRTAWRAIGPGWGTLLIALIGAGLIWALGASGLEVAGFLATGVFWAILNSFAGRAD
jgi:hypothetical protein